MVKKILWIFPCDNKRDEISSAQFIAQNSLGDIH